MNKPICVSICNQKGGVGKSDFTMLLASELYYVQGLSIAVIDCDYPQYTSYNLRQREIELVKNNQFYNRKANEQYERIKRPVYPIFKTTPQKGLDMYEYILSNSKIEYDIILFDLPGTVNNNGVIRILDKIDFFFIPIEATREVLESSLSFAAIINLNLIRQDLNNHLYLFWNKVDNREKNILYKEYEEGVIQQLNIPILNTFFPLSTKFRKSMNNEGYSRFLISTIFPVANSTIKDTKIDVKSFAQEIINIIQNNSNEKINKSRV